MNQRQRVALRAAGEPQHAGARGTGQGGVEPEAPEQCADAQPLAGHDPDEEPRREQRRSAPIPISHTSSSVAVPPERRSTSSPALGLDQLGRPVLARRSSLRHGDARRRPPRGPRGDRRQPRSRPTAGRATAGTARGESATEACVIGAGSSISDSTAPSDSASVKRRVPPRSGERHPRRRASSKLSIAPGRRIWRVGSSAAGWSAGRDSSRGSTSGRSGSQSASPARWHRPGPCGRRACAGRA